MKTKPENKCKICGKEFKRLAMHLSQFHHITDFKQYYDQNVRIEKEGYCLSCGKECNFLSVMYGYHDYCSTTCSNNAPEVQKKKSQTSMIHYGVDHSTKSEIVKEQIRNTFQINYGFDHPMKNQIVKDKLKLVFLENFGVDNPMKNEIIQKKSLQTCIERHKGTGNSSKEIHKKIINTLQEKYGVDNYAKTFEFRKLARDIRARDNSIQLANGEKAGLSVGHQERPFLNEIQKYTTYIIYRNNYFKGYFPDGWIKELNLLIEFDENWHNQRCWIKKDIQKNSDYISYRMNYMRIKEKDWKENKEEIIQNFLYVIEGLESIKRLQSF
jgi:hypothetical protein